MDKRNKGKNHKICSFGLVLLHCNPLRNQLNRRRHRMSAGCQRNDRCSQRRRHKLRGKERGE